MTTPTPTPTLSELRAAIPDSCFQPSLQRSLYYAVRDCATMLGLGCAARWIVVETDTFWMMKVMVMMMYALAQGAVFMGMFVIGHDAGHGSFSHSGILNYLVGVTMHSLILTPYTPWQITHANHHQFTGHIDRDEVFKPIRESQAKSKYFQHQNLIDVHFLFGGAWWLYLLLGFAPKREMMYHYNPFSPAMRKKMGQTIGSLIGLASVWYGMWRWMMIDGVLNVMWLYFLPLYIFAFFLVVITFSHHNAKESVTWYDDTEWSFVKGALSTVDRSYGRVLDEVFHDIGTHQVHHLFKSIPHYHLCEATSHFRTAFPTLVKVENDNIFFEFVNNVRWYRDHHIVPDKTTKITL